MNQKANVKSTIGSMLLCVASTHAEVQSANAKSTGGIWLSSEKLRPGIVTALHVVEPGVTGASDRKTPKRRSMPCKSCAGIALCRHGTISSRKKLSWPEAVQQLVLQAVEIALRKRHRGAQCAARCYVIFWKTVLITPGSVWMARVAGSWCSQVRRELAESGRVYLAVWQRAQLTTTTTSFLIEWWGGGGSTKIQLKIQSEIQSKTEYGIIMMKIEYSSQEMSRSCNVFRH